MKSCQGKQRSSKIPLSLCKVPNSNVFLMFSETPKELEREGMYVLRKKDDDDLFGGIHRAKTNKRSKRDKRKSCVSKILQGQCVSDVH